VGDDGFQAAAEKGLVERFDLGRKKPQRNLRCGTELRRPERRAARVENGYRVARPRVLRTVDIGSVNPDMARGEPVGGAALNAESRTLHVLSV